MNKKIKKEEEAIKTPEQPTTNVRSYFTKDINLQITEMTYKEMESVMKEFISTRAWIALLKYTSLRTPMLDVALRTLDPVKEPSKISWNQGAMAGLCDIETYVIDLNAPKPQVEAEQQESGEEEIDSHPEGIIS